MVFRKDRCSTHKDRAERPQCTVCQRIGVEHDIAERVVNVLLAAGYRLQVQNGEDESALFTDATATLDAMFETDEDWLHACDKDGTVRGWVRFIYGNDGWDVINDYTVGLEDVLTPVNNYIDTIAP